MTRDEFFTKFRGRMLVFLTEAWACRKESPSAMGLLMDQHRYELQRLMGEIYEALMKPNEVPKE